jgi:hypothetical protein
VKGIGPGRDRYGGQKKDEEVAALDFVADLQVEGVAGREILPVEEDVVAGVDQLQADALGDLAVLRDVG